MFQKTRHPTVIIISSNPKLIFKIYFTAGKSVTFATKYIALKTFVLLPVSCVQTVKKRPPDPYVAIKYK